MATLDAALLTAEEYWRLPDRGAPTELVQGKVVPVNMPGTRHGVICNRLGRWLGNFADEHDCGHVTSNDAGIITARDPDTVRGADIAFYSFARLAKDAVPDGYPPVAPELVFEVRSPSDSWRDVLVKVVEYLDAGVLVVCIVDPQQEVVIVYRGDRPEQTFKADDRLSLPELLPGFELPVGQLFV